jgi:hypothetical protein
MPTGTVTNPAFAQQLLDALDALSGLHPGFRPAHAKGLMCAGTFTPSPEAATLTRAPHASRPSTPVTVRYSNATGLPTIPDNDPARSGPRGMAIRFHLAEHVHADIVAHSTDGFPVRNGEEFLAFLRAAAAAGAGQPEALGSFLAAHPHAQRFVDTPKPIPTSFAGGVLRRHGVHVHQRRRREPSRAISHPTRSRDRVPLRRRRGGKVRRLPGRRDRAMAGPGAG